MVHQFSRNELAFGTEGLERLKGTTVLVLGIGGVGSFAAEACARSGVGKLILVDKDTVDITNVNRQLVATLSTVGREKVDVMKERVADINPDCEVVAIHAFYTEETYEAILRMNRITSSMRRIRFVTKFISRSNVSNEAFRSFRVWGRRISSIRLVFKLQTFRKRIRTRWRKSFVPVFAKKAFIKG